MPADGLVDVNKQTIRAIIPGLDCRAAKQIDKSRRMTIIGFSIVIGVGFGGYGIAYLLDQFTLPNLIIVAIITAAVYLPVASYLMRRWSIKWNEQFQQTE